MKKIVVITALGKNDAFREGGCPIYIKHEGEYNKYFRELIGNSPLILQKEIYDHLAKKSPLYPDHDVYIIDPQGEASIQPNAANAMIVLSLQQALQLCENAEKIIIFADYELSVDLLQKYENEIELFIKAVFNKDFAGTVFEPSLLMNFFPTPKAGMVFDESSPASAFVVFQSTHNPLFP